MSIYAIIIAGGRGKRFWPQSKIDRPKYLLRLPGQKNSLLQHAVSRLKGFLPNKNIIVVTNKLNYSDVKRQLPQINKKNIIGEPLMKNSAPAIALASTIISKKDPHAVIIVLPADQLIKDERKFRSILKKAADIAKIKDAIVTIGIRPHYPAVGFGYIRAGRKIKDNIFKADKFTEKPNIKKAKAFIKNKNYLWNSGIFIFKPSVMLGEIKKYIPAISKTLKSYKNLTRCYRKFPDISIDYAVMEKSKKIYVMKSKIKWFDVGSWKNLYEIIKSDKKSNIVIGSHLGIDTKGTVVIGKKDHLIGTVGLKGIVIIHTDKATLICKKEDAEKVKSLVNKIEKRGLKRFL